MINRERLLLMWAQPQMDALKKELIAACPQHPQWSKGKTLEEWAGETMLREGYRLALSNLGVEID